MFIRAWVVLGFAFGPVLMSAPCLADPPPKALDRHGFPLPEGALARLGDLRFVQPSTVEALAITPDGGIVASSGWKTLDDSAKEATSYCVFLWSADTGRIVRELAAPESTKALAFSRDGRLLAGGSASGEVVIWDAATGERLWWRKGAATPIDPIRSLHFIDRDRFLVAVRSSWFQLLDAKKGSLARIEERHGDKFRGRVERVLNERDYAVMAVSPSGAHFAYLLCPAASAKDNRGVVFIHDSASGRLLREVKTFPIRPRNLHLLDDGKTLLLKTACGIPTSGEGEQSDNVVLRVEDGKELFRFGTRHHNPLGISVGLDGTEALTVPGVSADGKSIFTQDGKALTRRELATGKKLGAWGKCTALALSADGTRAVWTEGRRLQLCDKDLRPVSTEPPFTAVPRVAFLKDGRLLSRHREGIGPLHVWDAGKARVVKTTPCLPGPDEYGVLDRVNAFDPLGRVYVYEKWLGVVADDRVADRVSWLLGANADDQLCPSADGRRILVTSPGREAAPVRWYDSQSGRELGCYRVLAKDIFPGKIEAQWLSEDGAAFGFLARDGRMTVVDCASAKVVSLIGFPIPLSAAKEPIWTYEYIAGSSLVLALGGDDRNLCQFSVWDRQTGQWTRRFKLDFRRTTPSYWEISPDGRLMAICELGTGAVSVYETASGRCRGALRASNPISYLSFAPDSKTLASSSEDTSILIWDLQRPLSGRSPLPGPHVGPACERIWEVLGDSDAAAAERAVWALVRAPEEGVALLRSRLRRVAAPDPKLLRTLIVDLGSEAFQEREAAAAELIKLGESGVAALRARHAEGGLSLEATRRIESLLARLDPVDAMPPCLRELRGIEALERIGSASARNLLEELSLGTPAALVTREARLALSRLRSK